MDRWVGTVSRGIRAPIIREGDDITEIGGILICRYREKFCIVR